MKRLWPLWPYVLAAIGLAMMSWAFNRIPKDVLRSVFGP